MNDDAHGLTIEPELTYDYIYSQFPITIAFVEKIDVHPTDEKLPYILFQLEEPFLPYLPSSYMTICRCVGRYPIRKHIHSIPCRTSWMDFLSLSG
jgi:hypothetical protein